MTNNAHTSIRNMVSEWKATNDINEKRRIFNRILTSVDRMLVSTIYRYIRIHKELVGVDQQDLYQTAIIGLYRAINGVKDYDPGRRILTRIVTYVKLEINNAYLNRSSKAQILKSSIVEDLKFPEPDFTSFDAEEMWCLVSKLIDNGEIIEDDFKMVIDHVVHGKSYPKIGKAKGLNKNTVGKRIRATLKVIRDKYE